MRSVALAVSGLAALVAVNACAPSKDGSGGGAEGDVGDVSDGAAGAGGGSLDAGDEATPDATAPPRDAEGFACPHDSVTNVPYSGCDLVEQDCPLGESCYPYQLGTNWRTHCVKRGVGLALRGDPCGATAECDRGLNCLSGFCTPFCCVEHQDEICGLGATCSVKLRFDQQGAMTANICMYGKLCDLWSNACPEGNACRVLVQETGMSACVAIRKDAPVAEGSPCSMLDECGDSMVCLNASGGGRCRYYCRRDDSGGPADAGVTGGAPGQGGCPDGQTCKPFGAEGSSWLGACSP